MPHTIAIKLKIPDNTAYSALTALRRLGVEVAALERADIRQIEDPSPGEQVAERVRRDESLFNPNKHALEVRDSSKPLAGEAWIAPLNERAPKTFVAYRLFADDGAPADDATVQMAVEKLLCNPAIERAIR